MIVDLFLVYSFLKRLATPFDKWKAYELGIIDEKGNQLKKRKDFTRIEERNAFGIFDIMILKLKKLIAKIPGGQTRIASYAAALYLIKEHEEIEKHGEMITEEALEDKMTQYMSVVREHRNIDGLFEEAIANSAGAGAVAGIGVGDKGEPGVTKAQADRYKKKKLKVRSFKEMM